MGQYCKWNHCSETLRLWRNNLCS